MATCLQTRDFRVFIEAKDRVVQIVAHFHYIQQHCGRNSDTLKQPFFCKKTRNTLQEIAEQTIAILVPNDTVKVSTTEITFVVRKRAEFKKTAVAIDVFV